LAQLAKVANSQNLDGADHAGLVVAGDQAGELELARRG
jgi:hypothetical protein